jgi:flagellar P-ring protein precursor FlgI
MGTVKNIIALAAAFVLIVCSFAQPVLGARIRDVARLSTDTPNELLGMGLVFGLNGTGDGGDYAGAMRPLAELMKRFDDPVMGVADLKNASNVAIVSVTMRIPPEGAREGESLDVEVTSIGAAKSLKGGRLFVVPMIAPRTDVKAVYGSASGYITLDDENLPTRGTIEKGGVLIRDILPEQVKSEFTLVLHTNTANPETATAVAERINEEVSAQTDGQPVATAVDATSVHVLIPKVEQGNTTAFIARIKSLPLPNIPEQAKVFINTKSKTIVFTDEVELSPTMISQGNITVTVASPAGPGGADATHPATATLKDLETAFNLMKVNPDDRITIVRMLHNANALKADLQVE